MTRSFRSAMFAAAALAALAGCGGGGGSGGGAVGGGGLAIAPAALEFVHVQGEPVPEPQQIAAAWTAADVDDLGIGPAQGASRPAWLGHEVIAAFPGSGRLGVSVAVTGLSPGTYAAVLRIRIERDRSVIGYRDVSVRLVVQPAPQPVAPGTQLVVGAEGVALTSTPGLSRLSRTLAVGTNRGPAVAWTAGSSHAWLHAAAAGAAGDPLVLTADPSGLATDAVHEAVVTVTSGDPALAVTTQTVRVGLWVGAATPQPVTTVAAAYRELVADPVRPYVYLVEDTSSTITIRNVHTGAVVGSILGPGFGLRSLSVTADGARLYGVNPSARKVGVVDLGARAVVTTWPLAALGDRIAWTRTSGVAALVSSSGHVYAPDTGAVLGRLGWNAHGGDVAVSRDGTRVCTADAGMRPYEIHCASFEGAAGELGPATIVEPEHTRAITTGSAVDLRLSPDGSRLYVADRSPVVSAFDVTAPGLTPVPLVDATTTAWIGALALDPGGRLHAGGRASTAPETLWSWDPAGHLLATRDVGEIVPRRLAVAGDGLRAVAVTGPEGHPMDVALTFVTLP